MDVEIRTATEGEFDAYLRMLEVAFSDTIHPDEVEIERSVAAFDRNFVAVDDGVFVGGSSAVPLRMSVPGARDIAISGITGVGVLPTHRRRGINTALMRRQLDDVHERGEPVAVLHASEGGIYGRYGFGVATYNGEIDIETARTAYVRGYRPSGRVRLLPRADAIPLLRRVYDRARTQRPGGIELDDKWTEWLFFVGKRDEDEPPFFAVHVSDEGDPDAYAMYKVKQEWPGSIPSNVLTVERFLSATPQGHADMWRYVFDVDLVARVKYGNCPIDDPLLHLLQDPRRLRLSISDGLWVRLVDLPAALAARGYANEGRLIVDVRDDFCTWNDGRYEIVVDDEAATCTPTSAAPEIACSVNALGAVYLGNSTFTQLAQAGLMDELAPGAIGRADAMFVTPVLPWSPMYF